MKPIRIDNTVEKLTAGARLREAHAPRSTDLRTVPVHRDADPAARLREAWFDRTFERVRGFLDEMFP